MKKFLVFLISISTLGANLAHSSRSVQEIYVPRQQEPDTDSPEQRLIYGVLRMDLELARQAIRDRANVEYEGSGSMTLLAYAVNSCSVQMVELLLANGADPLVRRNGRSAQEYAISLQSRSDLSVRERAALTEIVRILTEATRARLTAIQDIAPAK